MGSADDMRMCHNWGPAQSAPGSPPAIFSIKIIFSETYAVVLHLNAPLPGGFRLLNSRKTWNTAQSGDVVMVRHHAKDWRRFKILQIQINTATPELRMVR